MSKAEQAPVDNATHHSALGGESEGMFLENISDLTTNPDKFVLELESGASEEITPDKTDAISSIWADKKKEEEEPAGEKPEENQEPDEEEVKVPDKFKNLTKDQILKSYLELEKKHSHTSNKLNDLMQKAVDKLYSGAPEEKEEAKQEIQNIQKQKELNIQELVEKAIAKDIGDMALTDPDKYRAELGKAVSEISAAISKQETQKMLEPILKNIMQSQVKQSVASVLKKFPDIKNYESEIMDIFKRFPEYDDGTSEGIEKAYRVVKAMKGETVQSTPAATSKKKQLHSVSGGAGAPKEAPKQEDGKTGDPFYDNVFSMAKDMNASRY